MLEAAALTSVSPFPGRDADLSRAAAGDVDAFERVYRAHVGRIRALARRMAGPEKADELTQDIFVRLWQKLATFRGESAFTTWLHRLATNVIVEQYRSQRTERERRVDFETAAPAGFAGHTAPPSLRIGLDAALAELPEGARVVFVLHDVHGYKHDEIAERLGIAVGTSKAQLHRARMLMRRRLR